MNRRSISGEIVSLDTSPQSDGPAAAPAAATLAPDAGEPDGSKLSMMTFNIEADVGLELETQWHETFGSSSYRITGPPEVVAFLKRQAKSADHSGAISPPMSLTIHGDENRAKAGIPLEANTFCFCYPLECLSGLYEQLVIDEGRCDPWLFFLLLGGYAYFGPAETGPVGANRLVRTNAFVLTPAGATLSAIGPVRSGGEAGPGGALPRAFCATTRAW